MKAMPLQRIGFTQGVKASFDPSSIPPNALWNARNVRTDESGILRIRRGGQPINESMGAGKFQGLRSSFGQLLGVWNQNVYLISDTAGTVTQIGTGIGAVASDPAEMIRWSRSGAEIAYLFAGNGLYETDGATVELSTPYTPVDGEQVNLIRAVDGTQEIDSGPARCTMAILKASLSQRMVAAGDPESPNTVYLSAPLDGTYWPSDQIFQLPDDGGVITGLYNWYNAIVIFRDTDIWAFFGTNVNDGNASLVLQTSSVGCVSGRTIAAVPGVGLVFLGPDNIYALQGVSGVENQVQVAPLGDDIRKPLMKALSYDLDGVSAVYFDREYRIAFPECLEPDRVFRLSLQNNAGWYIDTGPFTAQHVLHNNELYGADYREGKIIHYAEWLLDDTSAIDYHVSFRRESLQPGPARIKKIYIYAIAKGTTSEEELFFFGPSFNELPFGEEDIETAVINTGTDQNLSVTLVVDGNEVTIKNFTVSIKKQTFQQLAVSEPVKIYEARLRPSLKGHFIQVRIDATTPEEDIAILGYEIEYSNRASVKGLKNGVSMN